MVWGESRALLTNSEGGRWVFDGQWLTKHPDWTLKSIKRHRSKGKTISRQFWRDIEWSGREDVYISQKPLHRRVWDHSFKGDFEFNDKEIMPSDTQGIGRTVHASWNFIKPCPKQWFQWRRNVGAWGWWGVCSEFRQPASWQPGNPRDGFKGAGRARGGVKRVTGVECPRNLLTSQRLRKALSWFKSTTGGQEQSSDGGGQFPDASFLFRQVIQHNLHLTFDT